MKIKKYYKLSSDDETINTFRCLDIKLVEDDTKYKDNISSLLDQYNLRQDTEKILEKLNKELKSIYRGKYKFDFCLNEGKDIEDVKINKNKQERLKTKLFQFNAEMARIKQEFEDKLNHIFTNDD